MRDGGGGDSISNGGHHPFVHTNHNNLRGGSSRNNTPLHSPASPTDNDFTDTDTDFSPDHREERYHRTKSPDGAQSVSSRTVRSHKTTSLSSSAMRSNINNNTRINDDSVQLDLPMADLMAYLQVVANNSSNLPLTRRDDPELGRTVSSLTSEEYALKCAAFIPANVRILGGMYGKYGSVWDLPTSEVSFIMVYGCHYYYFLFLHYYLLNNCNCLPPYSLFQEFDVATSTREPGISHGGPCCNALLKAMYDTESEVNNVTSPQNVTNKDLFDDDDDETVDTAGFTVDRTLTSFDTLVLNDGCNSNSMTWAQLLRKMKAEMQSVGFNQVPAVTSSYKFNLNEPFSLTPPDFKVGTNHKRALLIGCNYRNPPNVKLKACHDDVRSVKDFLVNVYGFPETPDYMTVLLDDKQNPPPTHSNITEAFKQLAEKSQPGDAVFVLFTGHGCRVLDSPIGETAESYDEAILPSDYDETGIIRDTLFFKTLLAPMRKGVTITCILDCCHTGVLFDLPYLWTTKGDKGEVSPSVSDNSSDMGLRCLFYCTRLLFYSHLCNIDTHIFTHCQCSDVP